MEESSVLRELETPFKAKKRKPFAERFYFARQQLAPRVAQIRKGPLYQQVHSYKGDNEQIKEVLLGSQDAKLSYRDTKKISDYMRKSLGLLDATVAVDPSYLMDYRDFLINPERDIGLPIDDQMVDPLQSVESLSQQFEDAMKTQGTIMHILTPNKQVTLSE
jgi:hypothetical protein